jgi:hypothetical protein
VEVRRDPEIEAYLEVRMWGTVSEADIDLMSGRLLDDAREWTRVLYDATEVENAAEALARFLKSPWRSASPANIRQAAVVGPQAAGVARAWLRATRDGTAGTQSFTTREAAREWLLAGYQSVTGGS